jgi:hypothetical protein
MQAVVADLEHHGKRLMAEPLAAVTRLALLVLRAGLGQLDVLTRLALSTSAGLGGLRLIFRHARMILCSEQVLDYEAKTSDRGDLTEGSSP